MLVFVSDAVSLKEVRYLFLALAFYLFARRRDGFLSILLL